MPKTDYPEATMLREELYDHPADLIAQGVHEGVYQDGTAANTYTPERRVAEQVIMELRRARLKHRPMASAHEGYAVILKELEELWDEVKAQKFNQIAARNEAIQIAAVAMAFAIEVCGPN